MNWTRLPPLASLRAFEAAARHGGFSAAARELNVTHAAIAQQVRGLERHLGLALARREGRGMGLTEQGAQLADGLTRGFGQIAETIDTLMADAEDRPLRISLTPSFAARWLMPRIGDFWKAHPEVALTLHPEETLIDLSDGRTDLAIRFGRGGWAGMECELLLPVTFVVAGTPSLLGGRTALTVEEMAELPWIVEEDWPEQRLFMERLGLDLSRLRVTSMGNAELSLSAARQGYGLSALIGTYAEDEIAAGNLVALHRGSGGGLGYHLCTRPGARKRNLHLFTRWIRSQV